MSVWTEVVSAGVAGTRRRPDAAAGWARQLDLEPEPAPSVLDVIALLAVGQAATPVLGAPLDLPEPAIENRPRVPVEVFTRIGPRGPVAELLALAEDLGLAAPAQAVPQLLEGAVTGQLPIAQVRTVTGAVGRFVAWQNPRWAPLWAEAVADGDDAGWLSPDPQTRLRWLTQLRRTDPARAREHVTRALDPRVEKPGFRVDVIDLLEREEQEGDVPLLETELDSRAEAVRAAAQSALINRRGGSPLQDRMVARFRAWVRPGRDGRFTVSLPDFTPTETRDGLLEGPRGFSALGVLGSAVPLTEWAVWGEPEQVVAALAVSRLRPLVEGLTRRIVLEHDRRWALACVEQGVVGALAVRGLIPEELLNARLQEAVAASRLPKAPPTALTWVFKVGPQALPQSLAGPLIAALPDWAAHHPRLARDLAKLLGDWAEPASAAELARAAQACTGWIAQDVTAAAERLSLRGWLQDQLATAARTGGVSRGAHASAVGASDG